MTRLAIAAIIVALAAAPAAAQGKGKKVGQGRKTPAPAPARTSPPTSPATSGAPASTSASTPAPTLSTVAVNREFGSWLDDASVLPPGEGWATISFGYAVSPFGHQTDFPVIDGTVGLTRRAQFGATLPYFRLHFPDGGNFSGFGDVYLSGKFSLRDPAARSGGIGVAVGPMLEVLSQPDPRTGGRLYWGAPVSLEFRAPSYRVYGSSGYFSRGAFFSSGAVEVPLTPRLIVTGALIHMRSLNDDLAADALGVSKTRIDLAGAAVYVLTPSIATFGSIGRTISAPADSGTSLALNAGVSIKVAGWTKP